MYKIQTIHLKVIFATLDSTWKRNAGWSYEYIVWGGVCESFPWSGVEKALNPHQRTFHHSDWLDHSLPPNSPDKALALEHLSHFSSFNNFLSTTTKTLRSNATFVISDWFTALDCSPVENLLLRHLANIGTIPDSRSIDQFLTTTTRHRLALQFPSLSSGPNLDRLFQIRLPAPISKTNAHSPPYKNALRRPALLTSFPLLRLAYHLGILEYHLCLFKKNYRLTAY